MNADVFNSKSLGAVALLLSLVTTQVAAAPFAALLPTSRSVEVDTTATVFATIINPDDVIATNCAIEPASIQDADFFYQTTDPLTNAVTGTINTPVSIPAGGSQSFIIGMTPRSAFGPSNVQFAFFCGNTGASLVFEAINTLLLASSVSPTPDVVAVALTASGDGIANIPRDQQLGFMAVATTNVGSGGVITAQPRDLAGLDGSVFICETVPATGECLGDLATSVTSTHTSDDTRTYSIFMSSDTRVGLDPALRRVALEFLDESGTVRGRTGVAVAGGGPSALTHFTDNVADQVVQNACVSCHASGGDAENSGLVFVIDEVADYQQINLQAFHAYLKGNNDDIEAFVQAATGANNAHPQAIAPGSPAEAALIEAAFLKTTE